MKFNLTLFCLLSLSGAGLAAAAPIEPSAPPENHAILLSAKEVEALEAQLLSYPAREALPVLNFLQAKEAQPAPTAAALQTTEQADAPSAVDDERLKKAAHEAVEAYKRAEDKINGDATVAVEKAKAKAVSDALTAYKESERKASVDASSAAEAAQAAQAQADLKRPTAIPGK